MKKNLMVLLLCLVVSICKAQNVELDLHITDISRIQSYSNGIPTFDDPDINDIFDNYNVISFAKTYPRSGYEYLRMIYRITCDSIGLAEELYALDSILFPQFSLVDEAELLSYRPNDWTSSNNDSVHLNLIEAPKAWGYTKGDSNIIIGITDTYFHPGHEDMQGQYANVIKNVAGWGAAHGPFVAGLAAARTDNNLGITGIGFKCRLNVSTDWGDDSVLLEMALDTSTVKTRVLNGSWLNRSLRIYPFKIDPPLLSSMVAAQGVYNEIYERGVSAVFGAGNGNDPDTSDRPWWFSFPASYDHNLSVSSVGYANSSGGYNVAHVHERHVGDSLHQCHNHNTRVDLCAPGYDITSHYYSSTSSDKYKLRYASGTSFSSPIVAGTIGLILSKMPWLTPYQVEYVLKQSATDIYSITANQKYANGSSRFTGRLGAGTLSAGSALEMLNTDSFFADNPDARTFRIKGVKVNTKCVPGSHPGVPNPRLDIIMENGTPPYTYKWEAMADNRVGFVNRYDSVGTNNISITLTASTFPHLFHYRLTVYDNSTIQKVASKVVRMQLSADSTWDLAMQDSYADWLDEPNRMLSRSSLDWDIWTSPDVWNRTANDGDTAHQNPDWITNPNYLHARVKNVGCIESPDEPEEVNLWLYWTLAATGETWPTDWIGGSTLPGTSTPAGGTITASGIPIPPLAPGAEVILSHAWTPPQPSDFDTTGTLTKIDVCALARIQTSATPNFGMTSMEIDTTKVNVLNNNNIVTRNFVSVNRPGPSTNPTTGLVVGNPSGGGTGGIPSKGSGTFTLQAITENQLQPYIAGHLASYMDVTIHMGGLYDVWDAGGALGNPTSVDEGAKTITWNMEQPLRLENIVLDEGERHYVIISFNIKSGLTMPYDIEDQLVHFRLISPKSVDIDKGDGTSFEEVRDYVHSAVNYSINLPAEEAGEGKSGKTGAGTIIQKAENWFDIHPNPVNEQMILTVSNKSEKAYRVTVTDVSGKIVYEEDKAVFVNGGYKINTARFMAGTYFINLMDNTGKTQAKKFVKVD